MKIHVKDQNGVTLHTANKYCEEDIEVRVDTEELNILPSTEEQVNEGLYNKVTVPGSPDLLPENIAEGKEICGVEGTAKTANFVITDATYLFYKGAKSEYLNEILALCEKVTSCQNMFYNCVDLTELDLSDFDTSNVTTMASMFYYQSYTTKINVSNFDTSNVTDMSGMFYYNSYLRELKGISDFNTTNVTNMASMFYECYSLRELDVSNFDTTNVTKMNDMFYNCRLLTELDVSNFDTSNVTKMDRMFCYCTNLTNLDLSNFDMSKVTYVTNQLGACTNLTNLISFKNLGKGYIQKTNNYSSYQYILSGSSNLTHESLMDVIINGLYDLNLTYDVANGGTLYRQKFSIGATNMAKLTEDEIQIAIDKGWNVE